MLSAEHIVHITKHIYAHIQYHCKTYIINQIEMLCTLLKYIIRLILFFNVQKKYVYLT